MTGSLPDDAEARNGIPTADGIIACRREIEITQACSDHWEAEASKRTDHPAIGIVFTIGMAVGSVITGAAFMGWIG
ncbi:MAG: hypothetical protein WKF61_06180 [Luteimonas sp.]